MPVASLVVVGIGEDGWDGLSIEARGQAGRAETLVGGRRHLDLVPIVPGQERIVWRADIATHAAEIIGSREGRVVVLASGDPMFHGVGSLLVRFGAKVIPAVSSVSLAAARLGWPLNEIVVLSACGLPLEALHAELHDKARVLLLSADADTPRRTADLLKAWQFGGSEMHVLECLGGPRERIISATADTLPDLGFAPLNLIALVLRASPAAPIFSPAPGLPDEAYDNDGQLTKREVRAITLAHLSPRPGALLWDIGAGSGSISIEWMRAARRARALAIEEHPERANRIHRNAAALGTPGLTVVQGHAPDVLEGLPQPDAVFIGGGLADEVFAPAFEALAPGGRLVANAVTIESERTLLDLRQRHGGDLIRIAISRAAPIGTMEALRPHLPVTQWTITRP